MKNILWVSDEPNWAYDANAQALAANMPQYQHHFAYTAQVGPEYIESVYDAMDIVVAMNPAGFYMYSKFDKVVSILDTVRALGDSNEKIFADVAGIICNNQYLFDYATARNSKVILQPNGVDLDYFKPSETVLNKFTVGFAGNVKGPYAKYKGYDVYQEAINSLPGIGQLNVLYGTESKLAPDRMVPDFYHKIDCLVLPSANEGCSNVITEALACGIPVICTKVGYHGHTLKNEDTCLFVQRTSQSIATAILQIFNSPDLLKNIKIRAREFAIEYHDIRKTATAYSMFFENIMQ